MQRNAFRQTVVSKVIASIKMRDVAQVRQNKISY